LYTPEKKVKKVMKEDDCDKRHQLWPAVATSAGDDAAQALR
jgi:hypothetical protein